MVNDIVEKPEVKATPFFSSCFTIPDGHSRAFFHRNRLQDPPPTGLGLPYVPLEQIFTDSDIICVFAPENPKTLKCLGRLKLGVEFQLFLIRKPPI